jgi:GWxTD domain-containing protein
MRVRQLFNISICIVTVALLSACRSMEPTATQPVNTLPYDYEGNALHPILGAYHISDDSTRIYFAIPSAELLYSRAGAQAPFTARVSFKGEIQDLQTGATVDTLDVTFIDDQASGQSKRLYNWATVKLTIGQYNLRLRISDENRNTQADHFLFIDKRTKTSAQNYLCQNVITGDPVFRNTAKVGETIQVESIRNGILEGSLSNDDLKIWSFANDTKLPPPPFSASTPDMPDFKNASQVESSVPGSLPQLTISRNYYFLSASPSLADGYGIVGTSEFYPDILSIEQLIGPLRFITSKSEYDEIAKSKSAKRLIDNFWIECAGSKEKAKSMIRSYYYRVTEANMYFSSYTEGWRTDRGMINIVFGNPNKITRTSDSETWTYGDANLEGSIQFVFKKVNSPFSENLYLLNRDAFFKTSWEQMVSAWRSGRVFTN